MPLPRQRPRHADDAGPTAPPQHLRDLDDADARQILELLVERLTGGDDEVRATALHELVALADARPVVRARAVAAVCAYLRSPWAAEGGGTGVPTGEPDLRRVALDLLAKRLRDPGSATSWCGHDLDLAGAVLLGADFTGCWFTGGRVRFEGAWAIEGRMVFDGARFAGARVGLRHWTSGQAELSFRRARFSGGAVSLAGAVLTEGVLSAAGAIVEGGTLSFAEIRLDGATLDLSRVTVSSGLLSLTDARLRAGRLLFQDARMTGGTTTLRAVRALPGVVVTTGALVRPGTVDVAGSQELVTTLPGAAAAREATASAS